MSTRDELIEAAAGAYRAQDPLGEIHFHPAWHDLDAAGRVEAARAATALRRLEALLDEEGLSTTARAVLLLIQKGR